MIKKTLIVIASLAATVVMALVGLMLFLSTDRGQQWLYDKGLSILQETLGTNIRVEHIGVNLFTGDVALYGAEIDDRQQVLMLRVDTLEADLDLTGIFSKEIGIESVKLAGTDAVFYKERPDTAANYQFVFDELSKNKGKKKKSQVKIVMDLAQADISRAYVKWDVKSEPRKESGKLDANHLTVEDFRVRFKGKLQQSKDMILRIENLAVKEKESGMTLSLKSAQYDAVEKKPLAVQLEELKFAWQDKRIGLKQLSLSQEQPKLLLDKDIKVKVEGLTFYNNNGKPRKNTGKPHRGWFDQGHLDVVANVDATVHSLLKDSIAVTVNNMSALDKGSGLDIKNLVTRFDMRGEQITLTNTKISLAATKINMPKVAMKLEKGDGKKINMRIATFPLSAHVTLRDIAKPFAMPLSNFTTPLTLNVNVGGDLNRIVFSNIRVATPDKRLRLTAEGDLCKVLEKHNLCLHFNNISMEARSGVKEQIVNHFAKTMRLKMMRQLEAMGDITYKGRLGIFYKREDIAGILSCKYGSVNFNFTLDGRTKYMTGMLRTDSINIGNIMNVKGLLIEGTNASYSFSIASNKGKKTHNRLPQGWLKANISGARYQSVKFNKIHAEIESNGSEAKGSVRAYKKLFDLTADFIYKQTDTEQSLRVYPHVKLHEKSEKEKAAAEQRKTVKAEIKAIEKSEKEERKAKRKEQREARKAEKAARKAARKAAQTASEE